MPTNIAVTLAQQDLKALAHTIRSADQGIAHAVLNLVELALTAGDALTAAKPKVGHGNWLQFVKDDCDISADRAERYMRIARGRAVLEANSARLRNLSITQALRLIDGDKRKSQSQEPGGRKAPKTAKTVDRLSSLAWSGASPAERRAFLDRVGWEAIRAVIPGTWDVAGEVLRTVSTEALLGELERRKPAHRRPPRERAVRDRAGKHAGPTLDITPEETKH